MQEAMTPPSALVVRNETSAQPTPIPARCKDRNAEALPRKRFSHFRDRRSGRTAAALAVAAMMRAMTSAKISVRAQANARRDELVGIREGVLLMRVAAPAL